MEELKERMAKIEGGFDQMNHRLTELREDVNHRFTELREDVNRRFGMLQWEFRIWFIVLLVVMTVYHFT